MLPPPEGLAEKVARPLAVGAAPVAEAVKDADTEQRAVAVAQPLALGAARELPLPRVLALGIGAPLGAALPLAAMLGRADTEGAGDAEEAPLGDVLAVGELELLALPLCDAVSLGGEDADA
jgi:hypothetical protein